MSEAHAVCSADEIQEGERKIVQIGKLSIGIFNVKGTYYALRNICPHQLAPLCRGEITGTTRSSDVGEYHWERDGEIIRCPWHGWEFGITDGKSVFNPHRVRVRTYPVSLGETEASCADCLQSKEDLEPEVSTYPVSEDQGMVYVHV
ncbi:MAG: Rieske (2Fe-2S) protein [Verrucomicrobiota bacterium]